MSDPDWSLLSLARAGYRNAWQSLVDKHYQRLVNLAFLITGSRDTACDIAQETFLRVIECHPKHELGTLSGYLSTIAFHSALKNKDRQRRESSLENVANTLDSGFTPWEHVVADEQVMMATRAIAGLDSDERNVLVLRFYGDLSYEEIATQLVVPIGTVKSRLFRAVGKCREYFVKMGVTP
ncbi:MAG: RNA polymerase sigma factor [bacterium]|nr:RNA polymerase sigma factor [bacterium]